jgi:hypothetical protein
MWSCYMWRHQLFIQKHRYFLDVILLFNFICSFDFHSFYTFISTFSFLGFFNCFSIQKILFFHTLNVTDTYFFSQWFYLHELILLEFILVESYVFVLVPSTECSYLLLYFLLSLVNYSIRVCFWAQVCSRF